MRCCNSGLRASHRPHHHRGFPMQLACATPARPATAPAPAHTTPTPIRSQTKSGAKDGWTWISLCLGFAAAERPDHTQFATLGVEILRDLHGANDARRALEEPDRTLSSARAQSPRPVAVAAVAAPHARLQMESLALRLFRIPIGVRVELAEFVVRLDL